MRIAFLFLLLVPLTILSAEFLELKSADGRTIKVRILSITESDVRVERSDGHKFTINNQQLATESLEFLWGKRLAQVFQTNRAFGIGFSDKRLDHWDKIFNFNGLEVSTYVKKIKIRKPKTLDIDGLELRYIIEIERDETGQLPSLITGKELIENSNALTEVIFESKEYSLHRMYLLPDHWWDRKKNEYEDKFGGIWVRLYYKGAMVYQESSPNRFMNTNDWSQLIENETKKTKPADPFAKPAETQPKIAI